MLATQKKAPEPQADPREEAEWFLALAPERQREFRERWRREGARWGEAFERERREGWRAPLEGAFLFLGAEAWFNHFHLANMAFGFVAGLGVGWMWRACRLGSLSAGVSGMLAFGLLQFAYPLLGGTTSYGGLLMGGFVVGAVGAYLGRRREDVAAE